MAYGLHDVVVLHQSVEASAIVLVEVNLVAELANRHQFFELVVLEQSASEVVDKTMLPVDSRFDFENERDRDEHHAKVVANAPVHEPRLGKMRTRVVLSYAPENRRDKAVQDCLARTHLPAAKGDGEQIKRAKVHLVRRGEVQRAHRKQQQGTNGERQRTARRARKRLPC